MLAHCGRYLLLGEVGSGSMGVVYRARDPNIDRLVAVKVLRHEQTTTEASTRRFLKEARAIGRLSHPNIVTVHDMGEDQGNIYFTMELVEGRSLADILQERRLETADAVGIGIQVAHALDYAHRRGVIHQDVKPGNILISGDGTVKITDFGIARLQDVTATVLTRAGEIMGTPSYMSPEQIEGRAVDGRSDIFSLGVVMYTMVTGRKPFGASEGATLAGLLNDILNVIPPAPMAVSPGVPEKLSALIAKALRKDPLQRFQTGAEMAAALKRCLVEPAAARAAVPRAAAARTGAWISSVARAARIARPDMRSALPAAVAVAALAFVGIAYFSFRVHESETVKPPPESQKQEKAKEGIAEMIPPVVQPTEQAPPSKTPPEEPVAKPPLPGFSEKVTPKPGSHENPTRPAPRVSAVKTSKAADAARTSVDINTEPAGALVSIDSNAIKGTTPLTVMLPIGKHVIKVTKDGYRDDEKVFNVMEGLQFPCTFTLLPVGAAGR